MSDKEQELNQQEVMQKAVVYYAAFLEAWIQNRMEIDKQLLTLSSLATGLLITFHDNLDDIWQLLLWMMAGGLFIATIIITMCIFHNNAEHIKYVIDENENEKKTINKKLKRQEKYAFATFILGVILTCLLAIIKSGVL